MSELFSYNIKRLSAVKPFKSEHQMESFLRNNPRIFGELRDPDGNFVEAAVIDQIVTARGANKTGRIDLMVLSSNENGEPILKIIELKLDARRTDFSQLKDYLVGFNESNKYKRDILNFIKKNSNIEDESIINKCYLNSQGIFIVSNSEPELIHEICEWNKSNSINKYIELYKLLQFEAKGTNFIVLDKLIEKELISKRKRISATWKEFADFFKEIEIGDVFYIDPNLTNGDPIEFNITGLKKFITLTPETVILLRKEYYLERSKEFGSQIENISNFANPEYLINYYFPGRLWKYQPLKKIFSPEISVETASTIKLYLTNLVQLCLFANEISKAGWVWETMIYHKKTNKCYYDLREELKQSL